MATAAELTFSEEIVAVGELASDFGWELSETDPLNFVLRVPKKGGGFLWVACKCDGYPALPPEWRWCGPNGTELDSPIRTPEGGSSFFHGNGVICAPWNRLAYNSVDGRGPHGDWAIGAWKANNHTKECTTLAAMASRIAVEALIRFQKFKAV